MNMGHFAWSISSNTDLHGVYYGITMLTITYRRFSTRGVVSGVSAGITGRIPPTKPNVGVSVCVFARVGAAVHPNYVVLIKRGALVLVAPANGLGAQVAAAVA